MKVLITAGPTREKLDAVRFLTNRSTGKMGYALAEAARDAGHTVTLVSGPVTLPFPAGIELIFVESAAEMAEAVKERAAQMELIIMCAAVADYRPKQIHLGKLKKQPGNFLLELERTEDILSTLGASKVAGQILVGFAAETDDLLTNAAQKLKAKNLDWICANDVSRSDIGFGSDENAVTLLGQDSRRYGIGPDTKRAVAEAILEIVTDSGR
ncbi:MAG: phosphopantothenoylcysteine decarboxylase [Victivallales bacterium]|jgi:phosphopantothenoylcysteine decarboxylase/phosphopantothenate--cysteine ligase|nr:phosphopantothenoylcysteine decarboxylase [Victivallales bacterium]